jgi:hypothetical protein
MRYQIRIIWEKARCERLYQPVVKAEGKKFRNPRNERPLSRRYYPINLTFLMKLLCYI